MCWGRKTGELLDGIQGQEFWGEIYVLEEKTAYLLTTDLLLHYPSL